MTRANPLPGELGRGPLGRITVLMHRGGAISLGFVLASLPAAAGALLLPWEGFAVLLVALLTGSVAVALSAALAAWRDEAPAVHPQPWMAFWRGWRNNVVDVLRAVAPGLLVVGIVAVTVVNIGGAGVGPGYAWLLLGIAGVTTLILVRVTVLATMFAFRTRDLYRLAAYTLFRVPRATVALLAMAVSAVGVIWLLSEVVLLVFGGLLARFLLHHERPVIQQVRTLFTHEG